MNMHAFALSDARLQSCIQHKISHINGLSGNPQLTATNKVQTWSLKPEPAPVPQNAIIFRSAAHMWPYSCPQPAPSRTDLSRSPPSTVTYTSPIRGSHGPTPPAGCGSKPTPRWALCFIRDCDISPKSESNASADREVNYTIVTNYGSSK